MKIRSGFVSNSSSSSFLVDATNASEQALAVLKEMGYKEATARDLQDFKLVMEEQVEELEDRNRNLLYSFVVCNQDDELYVLGKLGLPFLASVEYDSEQIYSDGKDVYTLAYGCEFGTELEAFTKGLEEQQVVDKKILKLLQKHGYAMDANEENFPDYSDVLVPEFDE